MVDRPAPDAAVAPLGEFGDRSAWREIRLPASAIADMPSAGHSPERRAAFARLLAAGTEFGFRPNSVLMHPGSRSTDLLAVVSGVLRMNVVWPSGRRRVSALIRAGDLVGADDAAASDHSVEAATMGRLRRIPRHQLDELVRTDAGVRALVTEAASVRLARTRAHMELLRIRSADQRVFGLLLQLSACSLRNGEASDLVWWPMSYADMADYLGLSHETVGRSISRLCQQGVLAQERRHWFRVLDRTSPVNSAASS